jgi:hypothetical protein
MMKHSILSLLTISGALLLSSCSKNTINNEDCEYIPAKIIRTDCDRVIFQLQTSEQIGDNNWVDAKTGLSYNNVVSYSNTCLIAELTKGEKMTIYVKLTNIAANPTPNCIQCQAISIDPPQTIVDFNDVATKSCEAQK